MNSSEKEDSEQFNTLPNNIRTYGISTLNWKNRTLNQLIKIIIQISNILKLLQE